MKGSLFLIPSPIGNLKEVSPRVLETISICDYIACEDTRNTNKLLSLLNLKKKTVSCHEHNEIESSINIVKDIIEGKTVGYLSDAGYPCISDPGYNLVKECLKYDIQITPLSGPNAFLNALVASGIDPSKFLFYGFLKSKESERIQELENLKEVRNTLVFYEAPHRIYDTLANLYDVFKDRKICIARELTKIHEEFIRTTLKDILDSKREIIGEIVLVVEGNKQDEESLSIEQIKDKLTLLIKNKMTPKDAILAVSLLFNINKNIVKKIYYSI